MEAAEAPRRAHGAASETINEFLEAYPDAIAVHRAGTLLFVNSAGLALIGAVDASQVLGRNVLEFVHPDSRARVVERLRQTASGARAGLTDERFVTLDGTAVDVEVVAFPLTLDGEQVTQLVIRDVTELRRFERENQRLEEEAREKAAGHQFTEEALELAERAAGLGVWDWDVATNQLRWTKGLEPLHGMAPGTFGGTFEHFVSAVFEEDRPALLEAVNRALTEGPDEFEARMRIPQGDGFRWILGKGKVFRDSAGQPTRMVGIGLDITERTSVELALRESEKLLRLVTGLLPANVAYIDRDLRYRFVNDTYQTWFNVETASVIGRSAREFMGHRAFALVEPSLLRALSGEACELEMDVLNLAGGRRYIHARYVPDRDEDGVVQGIVALINDVTALRNATHALEARSRAEQIVNQLGAALQTQTDQPGVARAAVETLVESLALAATIDRFEHGRTIRLWGASADRTLASEDEIRPATWEGHGSVARTVAMPLASDAGAMALQLPVQIEGRVGAVITLLGAHAGADVDEYALYREIADRVGSALERAELFQRLQLALAARDDFIGFTTHELKTPLTIVLGFADVLSRRAGELDAPTIAEISGLLSQEARRLEGIVENMLLLARAERGSQDEPTLVHRSAEKVLNSRYWRNGKRQTSLRVEGAQGVVLAPGGWVEQIIENLISNAEKYSEPETSIECEVRASSDSIVLTVLDRGRGVTEDQSRDVFEPFFRANPMEPGVPGIGLGLTVCHKLVDRLGGEIWLRPREGGGTEAGFRLPLAVGLDEA